MTKDVLVRVKGTQFMDDERRDRDDHSGDL